MLLLFKARNSDGRVLQFAVNSLKAIEFLGHVIIMNEVFLSPFSLRLNEEFFPGGHLEVYVLLFEA